MGTPQFWSALQAIAAVTSVALLAYAVRVLRDASRSQKDAAEAARDAARLHKEAAEAARDAAQWQTGAAEAARATVEAADKARRIAIRPALNLSLEVRDLVSDIATTPVTFALSVRNVGHGTALIERVQIFESGNLHLDYTSTDSGHQQQLEEQFDVAIFQRLAGVRLAVLPTELTLAPLTDETRALEVGGHLDLLSVRAYAQHANLVKDGLRNLSANVMYRSLAGEEFEASRQFAALREGDASSYN